MHVKDYSTMLFVMRSHKARKFITGRAFQVPQKIKSPVKSHQTSPVLTNLNVKYFIAPNRAQTTSRGSLRKTSTDSITKQDRFLPLIKTMIIPRIIRFFPISVISTIAEHSVT